MQTESLVDQQIKVEVGNHNGAWIVQLPDGQQFNWPISASQVSAGTWYLTLSSVQTLPTKEELAKLVLQEILKLDK